MDLIALDTETRLISDETTLPPLICLSIASTSGIVDLFGRAHAADVAEILLTDPETHIVAHNAPFDLGVIMRHAPHLTEKIFAALDADRVHDTAYREQLGEIRRGTFEHAVRQKGYWKLEACAKRNLGRDIAKGDDSWQKRFHEIEHIPIDLWPRDARDYATGDAGVARDLCLAQKRKGPYPDETAQVRAGFALKLASEYGMITDEAKVDAFEESLLEASIGKLETLEQAGIIRTGINPKTGRVWPKSQMGRTDMKALSARIERAYAELGLDVPRTDPNEMTEKFRAKHPFGQVKTDEDTLAVTDDPVLQARSAFAKISKLLTTYVPALRRGCFLPIHADLRTLVESGRTSCAEPNLQNLPRKPGARECFRPRPGCVFLSVDYSVAELRALAEMCFSWFGYSALREAFCSFPEWSPGGIDPHLVLTANVLAIGVEDAHRYREDTEIDDTRQVCKVGNFGFAGGLGAETFVTYARGRGVRVTLDRAKEIKQAWRDTWHEMRAYFAMIAQITSELGTRSIEQFGSGRVRGGVSFTEACNGYFQGLVADFAKEAFYEVTRRAYSVPSSALYGTRPVLFLHDEALIEVEEEQAHDAARECEEVMQAVEARWLPNVPPATDAHTMRNWSKKAKRVVDKHGRLIPWEDRERGRSAAHA